MLILENGIEISKFIKMCKWKGYYDCKKHETPVRGSFSFAGEAECFCARIHYVKIPSTYGACPHGASCGNVAGAELAWDDNTRTFIDP